MSSDSPWKRAKERRRQYRETTAYRRTLWITLVGGLLGLVLLVVALLMEAANGTRILPGAFVIGCVTLLTVLFNAWELRRLKRKP